MPANAHHLQVVPADFDESPVHALMRRIPPGHDLPALSKGIIEAISELDDNANSLERLTNLVLRDYGLSLLVVRTVNSTLQRRPDRAIKSTTRATMMLGAGTVRQLASSMLLYENLEQPAPALKALMVQSLLTANHAREVALKVGLQEPEEVHLLGMFSNLGEVLTAFHFAEDYARIKTMIRDEGQSEPIATNAVLGCSYADFGAEMSRYWGMPETVTQSMHASESTSTSLSAAVTAFSHDLTGALYGQDQTPDGAGAALDEVLERHSATIQMRPEAVHDVITSALNEARELFSSLNTRSDRQLLKRLWELARAAIGARAFETGDWEAVTSEPSEEGALQRRERLRDELESAANASSDIEVGEVFLMALEGALRAGPFDRVIACILDADTGRLVARLGVGNGVEALLPHFDFPMDSKGGPVVMATQRRAPMYLPNHRPMNSIEAHWAGTLRAAQFGVFPIVVSGTIVGCLYVDRVTDGAMAAITPDSATLHYVKSLSDLLVTAIVARRRLSTAAPVEPARETPQRAVPAAVPAAADVAAAHSGTDRVALVL
jgi:HD-like signal output (HDOD) protein